MTPKELQTRLAKRADRWRDELDAYAAELVRQCSDEQVKRAIDTVLEKKK